VGVKHQNSQLQRDGFLARASYLPERTWKSPQPSLRSGPKAPENLTCRKVPGAIERSPVRYNTSLAGSGQQRLGLDRSLLSHRASGKNWGRPKVKVPNTNYSNSRDFLDRPLSWRGKRFYSFNLEKKENLCDAPSSAGLVQKAYFWG